jgi:hypothetical protein
MRAGQQVTFVGAEGGPEGAVLVAIVGTGESKAKILDLRTEDGSEWRGVRHQRDAQEGEAYWTLDPPPPPAKKRRKGRARKK